MEYENFYDSPLTLLKGYAKVKLAQQTIDFFDASEEYVPQPLYFKTHYLYQGNRIKKHININRL